MKDLNRLDIYEVSKEDSDNAKKIYNKDACNEFINKISKGGGYQCQ